MRTFVFSELLEVFQSDKHVAYCYEGYSRGTIVFLKDNNVLLTIPPINYSYSGFNDLFYEDDYSNFELWAFIHEMVEEEDKEVREEAVDRLHDIYNHLYNIMPILERYDFILE